jgi:hypothetical protein
MNSLYVIYKVYITYIHSNVIPIYPPDSLLGDFLDTFQDQGFFSNELGVIV